MARARGSAPAWTPALLVALAAFVVFLPAASYPFLNWDDQEVFVRNDGLAAPGVVRWAFTTRYMEHAQPVAWLAWAAVRRTVGLTPGAAHTLSLALHAIAAALVFVLARRLAAAASAGPARDATLVGVAAALLWAVHPLRVEAVAWASAMPYPLAVVFALLAAIAWIGGRAWLAAACCALSLLARPIALLLPAVLWLLRRPGDARSRAALGAMTLLALAAGAAESSSRLVASLDEFGIGPRLTLAAMAPLRYLAQTLWPVGLTPLTVLPLDPFTDPRLVPALLAIAAITTAAWWYRGKAPVLAAAWACYLLLLLPVVGLVPSGLQAAADRYTYAAGVPLSIAAAVLLARTRYAAAAAAAVVVLLALLTWQQTRIWRDSVALWTQAVTVDPRNDVALYNLGAALGEAGRRDEAIARYDDVLALVPAHAGARRNRDLLQAAALEEEGNGLAARRDLDAAIERYARAVALDPRRTHARAALGMALVERGRLADARPHLQAALEQGAPDPAVPNALAFALAQSGDREAALGILRAARARFPGDPNIARNLATLERR